MKHCFTIFLLFMLSCTSENTLENIPKTCEEDLKSIFGKLSKAETDFANEKNIENCKQLKITIKSFLEVTKKCSILKPAEREGYQDRLANLDCK